MTALYSKGTGGNWSTLGTFNTAADGSGTDQVPTAADAVTVQAGDTVTLDTVGLSALTLAVSGTLTASTTATSDITVQQNATFASGSSCVLDMSAAAAYTCTVKIGGSGAGGFRWTFQDGMTALTLKGVAKTRVTRVNMAGGTGTGTVQITVDSTAGWANGDRICIATTDSGYTPAKSEVVTISGLSGNTFLATLAYAHADNAYVGNLSSNLIFTSAVNTSSATRGGVLSQSTTSASAANTRLVQDVEFSELGNNGLVRAFELNIAHQDNASWYGAAAGFKNNAIYNWRANGLRLSSSTDGGRHNCDIDTNVFAAVTTTDVGSAIGFSGGFYVKNSIKNTYSLRYGGIQGLAFGNTTYENLVVCSTSVVSNSQSYSVIGGSLFGNSTVFYTQSDTSLDNVLVGTEFGAYNTTFCSQRSSGSLTLTDCQIQTGGTIIDQWSAPMIDGAFVKFVNKNSDATAQEIYTNQSYTTPAIKRDNTTVSSSVSSVLMTCSSAAAITHKFGILAKASAALKILVYMRKSGTPAYGASTLPSITISGMGITPKTASMSAGTAADTWELVSLDLTSGEAPAVDGLLTVTLTAQSETAGAKAYFSGLPMAPFITRARHYGYLFDETSPTRTANATISAAFATADAYTGMAITWGASTSSIVLSADQTFQKLYDYSQAKAVANVASALMCTGAGVAGSPALFAGGAVTINDGFVLNGSGSISMGSYTLTTEFAGGGNYTYTGGTWSQLTTVPTFAGGTLNLGAAGTYTFTGSSMIISMTPTAPGTYSMGAGTFSGTIDLRNTTAHAITVEVPAGTTTTTANNTGGAITVSAPTASRGLEFTGLIAGSTVKVFDTGTQTTRFSTTNSGTSETWSEATAGSVTVDYTILKDGYTPIRVTGVTVTGATSGGVVATPIQQVVDRAYAASSGLSFGTTATVDTATKRFTVTTATTGQNWYSFMQESWRSQATLQNVAFPLAPNGPNSFTLADGWEFTSGINYLSRDGLRYLATGGALTAVWAAILSIGVPAGMQATYQQADGTGTTNAANTGEIDQLIQVYGDATHGNYDKRGHLVLKVQANGYDEAAFDVVSTFGTLEDQFYIAGLTPAANGIAGATITGVTITDHGATPVTWNGKVFSLTIKDDLDALTGTQILQYVRGLTGDTRFNRHDLVQANGAKFKTVRGAVYGDTGAALKGVRVVKADGSSAHADFDLFTADDGTTYAPPVVLYQSVTISGLVAGSRVQIYDTTHSTELFNGIVAGTSTTWTDTVAAASNRAIRLRVAYVSGVTAKQFIDQAIGTCGTTSGTAAVSFLASQQPDAVYNANAINGSTLTGYSIVGTNLTIDVSDGSATWGEMYAYQVYWLFTAGGIADQDLYIEATDTANYIFYGGFKIKNTSSPSVPLLVTGGNGEPSTGPATDLLDTTGGTIFCNSAIVVPYSSGAEATIAIVQSGMTAQGYTSTRAGKIDTIPNDVWQHNLP